MGPKNYSLFYSPPAHPSPGPGQRGVATGVLPARFNQTNFYKTHLVLLRGAALGSSSLPVGRGGGASFWSSTLVIPVSDCGQSTSATTEKSKKTKTFKTQTFQEKEEQLTVCGSLGPYSCLLWPIYLMFYFEIFFLIEEYFFHFLFLFL